MDGIEARIYAIESKEDRCRGGLDTSILQDPAVPVFFLIVLILSIDFPSC
jgi:hypothetical protein